MWLPGEVRDIGHRFVTVVLDDGTVRKLGNGSATAAGAGLSDVVSFTYARYWRCAVTGVDRSVRCWGRGSYGQLGAGELPADEYGVAQSRTPVLVLDLVGVRKLVSDSLGDHACALRDDGTLWCWGNNGQGQLGQGDTDDRWRPTQVAGLGPVVDVAAGSLHTCALVEGGAVFCWGADQLGQVGANDHSCALDYIFDPGPAPCQLTPVRTLPR